MSAKAKAHKAACLLLFTIMGIVLGGAITALLQPVASTPLAHEAVLCLGTLLSLGLPAVYATTALCGVHKSQPHKAQKGAFARPEGQGGKAGAKVPFSALLLLYLALQLALSLLVSLLQAWVGVQLTQRVLPQGFPALALRYLSLCILPAFLEEFVFRGGIQRLLAGFGGRTALLYTAAAFTLLHAGIWQLPTVLAMGLFLGRAWQRGRGLYRCMLLHLAGNTCAFVLLLIQQYSPWPKAASWFAGALALAGGVVFIYLFLQNRFARTPIQTACNVHRLPPLCWAALACCAVLFIFRTFFQG